MLWNDHSRYEGLHAFLGASNFRWINWEEGLFEQKYYNQFASKLGTAIHSLAKDCIINRIKLSKTDKRLVEVSLYREGIPRGAFDSEEILLNLVPFVNDAIGYHMSPEIILFYSPNCFGTTDAICFNEKEKILRIHDLKTGVTPAHIEQLIVYAALFCVEYKKNPYDFKTELRIYQSDQAIIFEAEAQEIERYMFLIKDRDDLIKKFLERDVKL